MKGDDYYTSIMLSAFDQKAVSLCFALNLQWFVLLMYCPIESQLGGCVVQALGWNAATCSISIVVPKVNAVIKLDRVQRLSTTKLAGFFTLEFPESALHW